MAFCCSCRSRRTFVRSFLWVPLLVVDAPVAIAAQGCARRTPRLAWSLILAGVGPAGVSTGPARRAAAAEGMAGLGPPGFDLGAFIGEQFPSVPEPDRNVVREAIRRQFFNTDPQDVFDLASLPLDSVSSVLPAAGAITDAHQQLLRRVVSRAWSSAQQPAPRPRPEQSATAPGGQEAMAKLAKELRKQAKEDSGSEEGDEPPLPFSDLDAKRRPSTVRKGVPEEGR